MQNIYIIKFKVSGTEDKIVEAIKTSGNWMSYFDGFWMIKSDLSYSHWHSLLLNCINKQNDYLLLLRVTINEYNGWLPKDAWEWLKS
jgi:hypothetical protein